MIFNNYNVSADTLKTLLKETLLSINEVLNSSHCTLSGFKPIVKLPESLTDEKAMKRLVSTFPPVWEPKLKSFDWNCFRYSEDSKEVIFYFFMHVTILEVGLVKYPLGTFCYEFPTENWSKL